MRTKLYNLKLIFRFAMKDFVFVYIAEMWQLATNLEYTHTTPVSIICLTIFTLQYSNFSHFLICTKRSADKNLRLGTTMTTQYSTTPTVLRCDKYYEVCVGCCFRGIKIPERNMLHPQATSIFQSTQKLYASISKACCIDVSTQAVRKPVMKGFPAAQTKDT